uniref:non-specific protein-tyrosine kinase n=1 Tax=Roseihalotalea indica TaxID=2867963 RepID=A0AA49JK02_9BACT|nr:polysaccharide biosynthesis tyrosine autokinase [Tunicatimonas sp. TK19036]
MEDIDVRVVIRKLLRKWYWFALSLGITLSLAFLYLWVTEETYNVATTIQLKDQSLSDKGTGEEKFLSGFELLDSDSELEDEIGILTSYSTIRQSLQDLGFEVSYFSYPSALNWVAQTVGKEVYPAPFRIQLDSAYRQLLYTPIHISFPDVQHYRVQLASDDTPFWLTNNTIDQADTWEEEIDLDTTLSINEPLQLPYLSFSPRIANPSQLLEEGEDIGYFITIQSLNDLTDSYQKELQIETISENSNITRLSLASPVPQKEKAFLSQLAEVYINNDLAKKNRLGERTIEFIDFQLNNVADSLRSTEGNLEDFRAENQVIDVGVTSQNLTTQLFTLEEKQAELSVQNEYYKYMAEYLASNENVTDVVAPSSVGIQDELLNSLLIQLSNLNEEKISKDYSSNPNNPVLKVLERKIQNTKQALIDNIDNLISSNNIGLRENNRRIANIKQTMNRLPQNERNLTDIERRFAFNDNIYNYLLQKRAEAGIAIASNVPNKSVIDAPRQTSNEPVSPNKLFIILLAFMAGCIMPAGLIFINDFFQVKVESDDQLAHWTNVPVIERVAQVKEKEKRQAYIGESYIAHAFRYIRHHVEFMRLSQEVQVIGVTSAKSGEGKTFIAKHLAESFAQAGRKTLLIDADLHHPTLAGLMNVRNSPGLGDALRQGKEVVIQHTGIEQLDVIGSGAEQFNPSDLLGSSSFTSLLSRLKQQYELIVLDTPPLGTIADYLLISKSIDYTLWVVRHEYSQKNDIQRLDKLTRQNQIKAGIIYNGTQTADIYSGYYKKTFKQRKV